jgi:arsenical pump membrane protein
VTVLREPAVRPPLTPLLLIGVILAGLVVAPALSVPPWLVATVGAAVMAVRAMATGRRALGRILLEANPLFVLFVAGLAVVVDGATGHGLQQGISRILPIGDDWPALIALAGIAAVRANLVNNLPATLVLLGAIAAAGDSSAAAVLAILIGVNIGPNLTYTGSLATLLWRRILLRGRHSADLSTFTRLGLLTVPPSLLAAATALWLVSALS